ncbi:hypothetical protein MMC11_008971 [Xylographa trunciseda]|nr:hypothetical protein [Xylographa trunciseda]
MQLPVALCAAASFCLLIQTSQAYPFTHFSRWNLTKTIHITIDTPIPANVSCASVLSILHCPVQMIKLNPLVESYTLVPNVRPITYSITDQLLLTLSTTYTASFKNRADGMDTVSHAAEGLVLNGHWTVTNRKLTEEIDITGKAYELPFVERETRSSHEQLHAALLAEAAEGGA